MEEKKKILVIDDDPEICDALTEILSENNYDVITALNTEDGLKLLENEKPDLLILDIMMATMYEGLDFATEIRKREGIWGIPIMIVSARPPAEKGYSRTIDEDMDWIHADIFMEKPVDPDDLIHNVRLLLK